MPNTELELIFHVRGPQLDPDLLNATLGIVPERTFHVGELRGLAAHEVAGWEWRIDRCGADTGPVLNQFMELFVPHREVLRLCVDVGARIRLKVFGYIGAERVASHAESERRGLDSDVVEPRLLDADGVYLNFDVEVLEFRRPFPRPWKPT